MFALSVQIISGLDSQSKFQMFTLFSGRHIGFLGVTPVVWGYTNMAALYPGIYAKYFDNYLKSGKTYRPKTWRNALIINLI